MANFYSKSRLKFNSVSQLDIKKEILNLSFKKATRKGDIPAKILKNSINPIQDGEDWVGREGAKRPPTNFSPVTSTNVRISPQNFLNLSFNPFATLV